MKRKYLPLLFILFVCNFIFSQELTLKKGIINDSIFVNDSIQESFSLYLPSKFKNEGEWPVLFIFDTKGKSKQAMRIFREVAEKENYILAASNTINDTITISRNVLIAGRMMSKVNAILPINGSRIYTAGFFDGGRFANLMPTFFKNIEGVITCGSSLANTELLNANNPFHFIGIVGNEDFNYKTLLEQKKLLNCYKFLNNLIVFNGGQQWPESKYLERAVRMFTLSAMAKGNTPKDSIYITKGFNQDMELIQRLINDKKPLIADRIIDETLNSYRTHINTDSLKIAKKNLKKDKLYRSLKRNENASFFKESLLIEDYDYYLEEDLNTYNYNNLGWWNYQMGELNKFVSGANESERQMGKRLYGYINALIEGYFEIVKSEKVVDDEALILLSMLKTITDPKNYEYYLNVISLSSKYEDYGTALFYLEEALKKGFKEKELLDKLEHTALFRIAPEYNKLIAKYLDEARYKVIGE